MADLGQYFVADTSRVGDSNLDYARLYENRRQFNDQQQLQKDRVDYQVMQDIGAFDPTGTDFDTMGNQWANEAKQAYINVRKKNPRLNFSQAAADPTVQQPLQKLKYYAPIAKSNDLARRELFTSLKSEHPYLPDAELMSYIRATQNKEGLPNARWREEIDLSPIALGNLAMPEKAQTYLSDFMDKNYALEPYEVRGDPSKGEFDYTGQKRPWQTLNGNLPENSKETIFFNGKDRHLLSRENEAYLNKIKGTPGYYGLLKSAYNTVRGDADFAQMDQEDQQRLLDQMVWEGVTSGMKGVKPTTDRSRVSELRAERRENATLAQQARANNLAERKFAFDQLKYREGKEEKERGTDGTFNGIVRLAADEERTPLQQKKLESFRVKPAAFLEKEIVSRLPPEVASLYNKKDEEGKKKLVHIYDISMGTKDHFIKDPLTGSPMKVYMWVTPKGGKGIVEAKYRKKSNGEYVLADKEWDSQGKIIKAKGKDGQDTKEDKYVNPYRVPDADIDQLLLQYQQDFSTAKKEEPYQEDAQFIADQSTFIE